MAEPAPPALPAPPPTTDRTVRGARRRGSAPRGPRPVRCESCLDVLVLRHAWDARACSCGAVLVSGRPQRPVVHWLSRPGGGWSETEEDPATSGADETAPAVPEENEPARIFGFSRTAL